MEIGNSIFFPISVASEFFHDVKLVIFSVQSSISKCDTYFFKYATLFFPLEKVDKNPKSLNYE